MSPPHAPAATARQRTALAVAALGVVYGDIGTSPLYSMRETFGGHSALPVTEASVLGVLSVVTWSLILLISIKYLMFILRADNHGEGGILALAALVIPPRGQLTRKGWSVVILGLFGAALLYGDGMITPAISVLSAVEGLEVATPVFAPYVLPITVLILVGLFLVQSQGTAKVGRVFGPIMVVWFVTLGLLGLPHILAEPGILRAVNPAYALGFFGAYGRTAFLALGSIYLAVTGGEALYADMGHFGPKPIRASWFSLVLPALVLNYYGQGALMLGAEARGETMSHPFFHLAPEWALIPLVILAACATVIASQSVISGAFSLTMQAAQLGYSPRVEIRHTSAESRGQVYVPAVNWILMVACIGLVLGFRTSSNLAGAYGIAVSTLMVITTLLFFIVVTRRWGWSPLKAGLLCGAFLVLDGAFFAANLTKFLHGGWFPILIALIVFLFMVTWKQGRQLLANYTREHRPSLRQTLREITAAPPLRVPGTAVFLSSNPSATPPALSLNLDYNRVLHQQNVFLHLQTLEMPEVPWEDAVQAEAMGSGFYLLILRYGFMVTPDVPEALRRIGADPPKALEGVDLDPDKVSFFLGREQVRASERPGMALWRERLFGLMMRNARPATTYFGLPPERVIEIGAHVEI